jgi:hypothetical protein
VCILIKEYVHDALSISACCGDFFEGHLQLLCPFLSEKQSGGVFFTVGRLIFSL